MNDREQELEICGPDGIQVLRGDAAKAHVLLGIVMHGKMLLHLEAEGAGVEVGEPHESTLAMLDLVRSRPMAEPYKRRLVEAIESWIEMQRRPGQPPRWTEGEEPLVAAFQAGAAADDKLTQSMTPDERRVDALREVVRGLLDVERSGYGSAEGQSKPLFVAMWEARLAEMDGSMADLPAAAPLLTEARRILERLNR